MLGIGSEGASPSPALHERQSAHSISWYTRSLGGGTTEKDRKAKTLAAVDIEVGEVASKYSPDLCLNLAAIER